MSDLPAGTVTFLFTDIEGSTRLLEQLRDRYAGVLAQHHEVLRETFARFGGHEVDTQGDAFFVAFSRAGRAVAAAVAAQRALAELGGRIGAEAAFARLAGAAPIPVSSGQTVRYRLDRKLNRALHMILVTPKRSHPAANRLHQPTPPRRQDPTRSKPVPQALPRPQPLPPPRTPTAASDLTSIEASLAHAGGHVGHTSN